MNIQFLTIGDTLLAINEIAAVRLSCVPNEQNQPRYDVTVTLTSGQEIVALHGEEQAMRRAHKALLTDLAAMRETVTFTTPPRRNDKFWQRVQDELRRRQNNARRDAACWECADIAQRWHCQFNANAAKTRAIRRITTDAAQKLPHLTFSSEINEGGAVSCVRFENEADQPIITIQRTKKSLQEEGVSITYDLQGIIEDSQVKSRMESLHEVLRTAEQIADVMKGAAHGRKIPQQSPINRASRQRP